MHTHILYPNYLNPNGEGMSIGGIQTYITNLIPIILREGYEVHIYQRSTIDFIKEDGKVIIHGFKHPDSFSYPLFKYIFKRAKKNINAQEDLVIFGTDACIVPCKGYKSIAIQHGIWWDICEKRHCTNLKYLYHFLQKSRMAWCTIKRDALVDTMVCVDHNFVNWYRALTLYPKNTLYVIPNFSEVPPTCPTKPIDTINIIFARRLQTYRGTRLFTNAISKILKAYPNINVTIAGTGPDEQYMKDRLKEFSQVTFTTYESKDSLAIHEDKHIAVVPTIGSEGTSLSLLEAMSSGCAVICTNVGGMTNIVIDHFNGIMINPEEEALYQAIKKLIENRSLLNNIANNAYHTVCSSFSLDSWQEKWAQIIRESK